MKLCYSIEEANRVLNGHIFDFFVNTTDAAFAQACDWVEKCGSVICCIASFGAMNEKNRFLAEYARKLGKLAESAFV